MADKGQFASVPEVEIDSTGNFKYILIKAHNEAKETKHLVRGTASAKYHKNILDKVEADLRANGISVQCLGGGRIEWEDNNINRTINIFGRSDGYGPADHAITANLIKKAFPGMDVTIGESS